MSVLKAIKNLKVIEKVQRISLDFLEEKNRDLTLFCADKQNVKKCFKCIIEFYKKIGVVMIFKKNDFTIMNEHNKTLSIIDKNEIIDLGEICLN